MFCKAVVTNGSELLAIEANAAKHRKDQQIKQVISFRTLTLAAPFVE